jgi:hypothetical protein
MHGIRILAFATIALALSGCTSPPAAAVAVGYRISSESGTISLTGTKCTRLSGDWQLQVTSAPGATEFNGTMVAQVQSRSLHGTFLYNVTAQGVAVKGAGNAEIKKSGKAAVMILTSADPRSPLNGSFAIQRDASACK